MQIRIDDSALRNIPTLISNVGEKAVKKALVKSIRRTLTGVRARIPPQVKQERILDIRALGAAKLKSDYLKEYVSLNSREISNLSAEVSFSSRAIPAQYFFAKRLRIAGAKSRFGAPLYRPQITVNGKTYTPRGSRSFMPNLRTSGGKVGPIFARKTNARLPIEKIFGPRFSNLAMNSHFVNRIQEYAAERLAKEFDSNLSYYLSAL